MVARFVLGLHLHYNHCQHLSYYSSTSLMIRSVSSSVGTIVHLSLTHNVITCAMLGYISSYSLTAASCVSATTPSYYLHTYSCLSVCRSSILLASLCSITLSSHSLPLRLAQLSSHLLDHYHSKVVPLGRGTCLAILIHACASSSASTSPSITYVTYFFGPCDSRIMDIGCVSLSSSMGIVGLKVAITL